MSKRADETHQGSLRDVHHTVGQRWCKRESERSSGQRWCMRRKIDRAHRDADLTLNNLRPHLTLNSLSSLPMADTPYAPV
jgi:hypothetical protein